MNRHSLTIVATFVASGALMTTTAHASQTPDARDANTAARAALSAQRVDLRSPDARDASGRNNTPPAQVYTRVDGRSPDTVDAVNGVRFVSVPSPVTVVSHPISDGFQWGDAGLGAGIVLALLGLGAWTTMQYRRRHQPGAPLAS